MSRSCTAGLARTATASPSRCRWGVTTDLQRLDEQEAEQVDAVRPPGLNQNANRSATRLELFFDLAFVLFISRCANVLAGHESWATTLAFAALLSAGWWAWATTTLYANRFDTDDAVFRLIMLTAMAGVVVMVAAVDKAANTTGSWFVYGYVLIRLALVAGYLRAWRHVPKARTTTGLYLAGHTLGAAIWLGSLAVTPPARFWCWGAGVLIDLAWPAAAAWLGDVVPLHLEHLPDRFGLFIILVLGESVTAIVVALHDAAFRGGAVVATAAAFVTVAALWWTYFNLSGGSAKRRLVIEDDQPTKHGVHDFYVYIHLRWRCR